MRVRLAIFLSLIATSLLAADLHDDYTGRYEQRDGNVVIVALRDDGVLTLRPLFWHSVQELVPDGEDRFLSRERPERKAQFARDASGRVTALTMNGIGHDDPMPRLASDRVVPAELLMRGRPREAARALLQRSDAASVAASWGNFLVQALPTKANDGAAFLAAVVRVQPDDARLREVHAALLVAAGRRTEARKEFRAALAHNPESREAAQALRMLAPDPSLDALFARPTTAELDAVAATWAKRDLSAREVTIVHRGTMRLETGDAEVRILAHRVHGSLHYGAVIVPAGAAHAAVIVEAKGVSPTYFPLDLSRPPYAPAILGDAQNRFVYFLPSYRGEVLRFDGRSWTSEGDRTDVWDGATDDFLAFTTAALTVTPEADATRMCAFGKSRGGTVALLAGERDPRFRCVVAWSAPTDHFFAMVQSGWSPRERVAEGLRAKSDVFGIGGQFLETFLAKPRSTAERRLHLIASSPLWFAKRLPRATQAHYGLDDNIVSTRNGRALQERNPHVTVVEHAEAGHDLDRATVQQTRAFFLGMTTTNDARP